jgi:hypothetical protein
MSVRAVILGLLGAVLVAGLGYLNDQVLRLNFLVGNHFPISVFGALIILAGVLNPLLRRLHAGLALRPAELAVTTALVLVACSVPGSSLMRTFTPSLVMPVYYNSVKPGWRNNDVLGYVPPEMLPAGGRDDPRVVSAFLTGEGRPGEPIGLSDVPWYAWRRPLATWVPLIFLAGLCAICMGLIVHHQWARRERLRYPIVDFADAIITGRAGSRGIFTSWLFWGGLAVTLCLHLVNGSAAWFPGSIRIPMQFVIPLDQKYPALAGVPNMGSLLRPILYPTFVAFAYFIASDVSFSLGVSQVLFVAAAGLLMVAGVDISQGHFSGGPFMWERFGAYLAVACLLVYSGRAHYRAVFRRALLLPRGAAALDPADRATSAQAWAARILIVSVAAMCFMLVRLGLPWPLAVLAVVMLLVMYLILSRINAESGLFHAEPLWEPIGVLLGLFGAYALGLKALAILALFTAVLAIDPRATLMPFVVNGLKMSDDMGARPSRTAWAGVFVLAVALAVAVPVVLWANYNFGIQNADEWSVKSVPTDMFDVVSRAATSLRLSGTLDASGGLGPLERIASISPDPRFFWFGGAGIVGVVALGCLRMRLPWWPLHPIVFLVAGTWTMEQYSHSFLLGWLIKAVVTRLGGAGRYRGGKLFMIGIVAGDLLGGLLFMVIGAVYYWLTGLYPEKYFVFPN